MCTHVQIATINEQWGNWSEKEQEMPNETIWKTGILKKMNMVTISRIKKN